MASAFKAKVGTPKFRYSHLQISQGNEAFKSGDYATAIGEYTKAIMASPKDATFALNRAAAYLKLEK